ncbi:MAG TPA: glycosyltransferase family 4 protein [Usitatibacter sp.]|nr:glycosyltransferase family 4 protein [Usitatibacter sp.]
MTGVDWGFVLLFAFAATAIAIAILRRSRLARHFSDVPNERSLHDAPVPRLGGVALIVAAAIASIAFADHAVTVVLGCAVFLCAVSLLDDRRSLPIQVRLPAHFAAAIVAVLAIGMPATAHSGAVAVECGIATLAIVWTTNAFNFMDGADGLAGGMAAIGFGCLAVGAGMAGAQPIAAACAALASASLGFLVHNFPPARVFLGDSGSVPLGFLAGALGWLGVASSAWPAWFPLLAFAPFLVDATATLLGRVARGERFWIAHRSHAYQRLVLAGWTHRRLALAAYVLMALTACAALTALRSDSTVRTGILSGSATFYVLAFLAIEARLRRTTTRQT